ncbi:DMT family transporter [Derxia lacustris]|uniref:DMT family transporter n=1 Tax=Derxia lacustris TaxID=764842 RepID=UPI000A16CE08|nr:DMT family transporter [Derxia lacustris]
MQSLWMLAAAALFSLVAAFVKLAIDAHSAWEILFWRNAVGLAVLLPMALRRMGGLRALVVTPHWRGHLARNASGTTAVLLWFATTAHLPLATALTLNYTSSLFLAALLVGGAWRAGRRGPGRRMLAALLIGFAGIVCVLRPTLAPEQWLWGAAGLASGLLGAGALLSLRTLGQLGEPSTRTVFYFSLSGAAAGAAGMLAFGAHWPDARHLGYLLAVGGLALVAQLALTHAYGRGKPLLAATLGYSTIVFGSGWGWLVWGDVTPAQAWIGIGLIAGAGAWATLLTAQATADPAAAARR